MDKVLIEQLAKIGLNLKEVGLNIQMGGFLLKSRNTVYQVYFPNEVSFEQPAELVVVEPTAEEYAEIIRQMDIQEIELTDNLNAKVVVRKSQRNMDQQIVWQVFARDGYTCRYCGTGGKNGVPMTYDHIKLWEDEGETSLDNGLCTCRKCNKTRGNMDYADWLNSEYYFKRSRNLTKEILAENTLLISKYKSFPSRVSKRKR